jgi:hypothetical protein
MTRIDGARPASPAATVEWQKALQHASIYQPGKVYIAAGGGHPRSVRIDRNFGLSTGLKRKAA